MKLFIDTANINEIREAASWGVISGVTTNPTLFAKAGGANADLKKHALEIARIVNGPVNVEAVSEKAPELVKEAKELAGWHKNIVVKIAMNEEGIKAVRELSRAGVKTNVSLVFSVNQALLAATVGADYVSPFVGRLDDAGEDGIAVVHDIVEVLARYGFKTKVIAASIRSTSHVVEAAKAGAPIATVPFSVLKQMFRHPLTDAGIKKFLEDWKSTKKKKSK